MCVSHQMLRAQGSVFVDRYIKASALFGKSGATAGRIATYVHEIGHALGLPDLYDSDPGAVQFQIISSLGSPMPKNGKETATLHPFESFVAICMVHVRLPPCQPLAIDT
jgi:hypothetical protein